MLPKFKVRHIKGAWSTSFLLFWRPKLKHWAMWVIKARKCFESTLSCQKHFRIFFKHICSLSVKQRQMHWKHIFLSDMNLNWVYFEEQFKVPPDGQSATDETFNLIVSQPFQLHHNALFQAILASCRCIKVRNIIILGKKKTWSRRAISSFMWPHLEYVTYSHVTTVVNSLMVLLHLFGCDIYTSWCRMNCLCSVSSCLLSC